MGVDFESTILGTTLAIIGGIFGAYFQYFFGDRLRRINESELGERLRIIAYMRLKTILDAVIAES